MFSFWSSPPSPSGRKVVEEGRLLMMRFFFGLDMEGCPSFRFSWWSCGSLWDVFSLPIFVWPLARLFQSFLCQEGRKKYRIAP